VAIATRHILSDRAGMLEVLEWSWLQSLDIIAIIESTSALSRRLENEANSKDCMVEFVDRIELCDDGVAVTLKIRVSCFRAGVQTSSILGLSSAQRNALGIKQGAVFSCAELTRFLGHSDLID